MKEIIKLNQIEIIEMIKDLRGKENFEFDQGKTSYRRLDTI